MKILLLPLILVTTAFADEAKWPLLKDKLIYSATVNETEFKVYFSTSSFVAANHEIVPLKIEGYTAYLPKVDGHTAIGIDGDVPADKEGFPHLTRLAVSFGEKIVEASPELLYHIFMPHPDMTFTQKHQSGRVAVSSDGKTVTVELSVGDGGAGGSTAFTFSSEGTCVLGLPEPPTP